MKKGSREVSKFTEEGKEKRHQYYQKCKKLPDYRKNHYLAHKKQLSSLFKDPKGTMFVSRMNS